MEDKKDQINLINGITGSDVTITGFIRENVFYGTYQGKNAIILDEVSNKAAERTKYCTKSEHLPEIYKVYPAHSTSIVIMEHLIPFVYESNQLDTYVNAMMEVKDVCEQTDIIICPEIIMMRGNNTIVFYDIFMRGSHKFYYHGNDIIELKKTMLLTLLVFAKHNRIIKWMKNMCACIDITFQSKQDLHSQTDLDDRLYHTKVETSDLYICFRLAHAVNRIRRLAEYLHKNEKCFADMKWNIAGFLDKDYQAHYNEVVFTSPLTMSQFLERLFEYLKSPNDIVIAYKKL